LFCLNWSPDGSRLLCHSEGTGNPADAGLYTVRSSDAGDLVRVSTTPPGGFDIDGSRILYAQFANEHGTLFSVKPDGSDPVQLSPPELSVIDLGFFDRVGADWAPDGSRVAFAAFDESSRSPTTGLFVVNADGSGLRQITTSRGRRAIRPVVAERRPDRVHELRCFTQTLRRTPGMGRSSGRNRTQASHAAGQRCQLPNPGLVTRQHQAPPQQTRPRQRPDLPMDCEHRRLGTVQVGGHRDPFSLCMGKRTR
jgi:Tol biopolymer transport system component